jgi:hypothetical protein
MPVGPTAKMAVLQQGLAGARPSSTARLIGPTFQELEGFVVASAVEEVG